MKTLGIWSDSVRFDGTKFKDHYVLAIAVLSFIAFIGLFIILIQQKDYQYLSEDANLRIKSFNFLLGSIWILIFFYGFNILDIFLHQFSKKVKYGYFFTYFFSYAFFLIANISILIIICRITYFHFPLMGVQPHIQRVWRILSYVLLLVLLGLGLFDISLVAAFWILFLNSQKTEIFDQIGSEWWKIDHAFQIIYLIISVLILVITGCYVAIRTRLREKPSLLDTKFLLVAVFLLIRSANVESSPVYFNLSHHIPPTTRGVVKEALFGLPSLAIYYLVSILKAPITNVVIAENIRREGRIVARKELARRKFDASRGGPPLPTARQLLDEMEKRPMAFLPVSADERMRGWPLPDIQLTMSYHVDDVLLLLEKA